MFKAARNDYRVYPFAKSRGIALLVMLAIILVAFTTIAISRLSLNSVEQKARAKTTQSLIQSRDALMAFALTPVASTLPGTLPCPDGNADGISDPLPPGANSTCLNQRGLVPFITLNIPQPLDGTGAPIWYVVANEYSSRLATGAPRDRSVQPALRLNVTLPMAFILFAPNYPIPPQVRANPRSPRSNEVGQFLEGDNANNTLNSYTNMRDDSVNDEIADTQNDQVLGMPVGEFWDLIEGI